MAMKHLIFAVVGPSGSGKTTLTNAALEALPDVLRVIKTYTTRARREGEADRQHVFITREDASRLLSENDLVESDEYAGNFYGTPKSYLDSLLLTHHGIKAITEAGIIGMKNAGYAVRVIRIEPKNASGTTDNSRATDDAKRKELEIQPDIIIENDFAPGGQERAMTQLISYIQNAGA